MSKNHREIALTGPGCPAPIPLTPGHQQLLLDDFVIQEMAGLTRSIHQPRKTGPVFRPDTSADGNLAQIRSAPMWVPDQGLFKIIYLAYHDRSAPFSTTNQPGPAYAFSTDGITWQKPSLGYMDLRGSSDNNRIRVSGSWPTNALENVVYDPGEADAAQRYKGFISTVGRQPSISADGLTWTHLAVPDIPSGDEAQLVGDPDNNRFLALVKSGGPCGRAVSLATSTDFESWTTPTLIFAADELDRQQARDVIRARIADPTLWQPLYIDPEPDRCYTLAPGSPSTWTCDVYNMAVFPYEGLYIGLPAVFYATGLDAAGTNTDGFHHIQLTASRDLTNWERLGNRQPFIGPSPIDTGLVGVYDRTQLLPSSKPIRRGDQLWFYYSGLKWRDCRYLEYPDGTPRPLEDLSPEEQTDLADGDGAVCLAVLRLDGFISLDAAAQGYVQTKPLILAGSTLYLNVDAAAGQAHVEILNAAGTPISGFTRADCTPITVDGIRLPVAWTTTADLSTLAGQTVSLRIYLTKAKLYSFGTDIPRDQ